MHLLLCFVPLTLGSNGLSYSAGGDCFDAKIRYLYAARMERDFVSSGLSLSVDQSIRNEVISIEDISGAHHRTREWQSTG